LCIGATVKKLSRQFAWQLSATALKKCYRRRRLLVLSAVGDGDLKFLVQSATELTFFAAVAEGASNFKRCR
jgi:hypothetical protein